MAPPDDFDPEDLTSEPGAAWAWTDAKFRAALDVALDDESDETIAERAGVDRRTLARWKRIPEFCARVSELLEASYEACKQIGLATRERRVQQLVRRHAALCQVIRERIKFYQDHPEQDRLANLDDLDDEDEETPPSGSEHSVATAEKEPEVFHGLATGFVVVKERAVGKYRIVREAILDVAILAEFRALEEQIAREVGHRRKEIDHSGSVTVERAPDLSGLTDEELAVYETILAKCQTAEPD